MKIRINIGIKVQKLVKICYYYNKENYDIMRESQENYLETIYLLQERNGTVRSVDIAKELGYSKPSISRAMKLLKTENFIDIDESGCITFTKKGLEKALDIYDKHVTITRFFTEVLGLNKESAEQDACRIEHVISDDTFYAIKKKVEGN